MVKNKLLYILITILLITSIIVPITMSAFADVEGDGYKYTSDSGILEIFNNSPMVDYSETSSTKSPWYSYKDSIKKIVIHDGVTKIGSYDFAKMNSLVEVDIPSSVTKIGEAAFAASDSLVEIAVPDSVTAIGNNAFGFNSEMKVTDGFICHCSSSSEALQYCFKNYIPFDAPATFDKDGAVTDNDKDASDNRMTMWSIVPERDIKLTFYSVSSYDTCGMIFDAENYIYSKEYSVTKGSALAFNDDSGENLNFKVTYSLKAGKRYYLATKFALPSKTGTYKVKFERECIEHTFNYLSCEQDFFTDDYIITEQCDYCGAQRERTFAEIYIAKDMQYDFNNDGIVNAKDYAMMIHN